MPTFSDMTRAIRGCDHWNGAYYCAEVPAPFTDEVDDNVFCAPHAGPLNWPDRYINLYSLALVTCGYLGMQYHMPTVLAAQLYPEERAA
jgi:hypothetical protein